MGSKAQVTLTEISNMTGLHKNTLRNYIKKGRLEAEKIELDGVITWVVGEDSLYNSGISRLNSRLGSQGIDITKSKAETERYAVPDKYLEELTRLSRELLAAREELAGLRIQVPALQAAQAERDSLREDNAIIREKLEEARANAKWSWRRRQAKAGNVQAG